MAYPEQMSADRLGRNRQSFSNSVQRGIRMFLWNSPNRRISFASMDASGAFLFSEFFVAAANFADPSKY
jgi:hypothetical protein